MHKILEYLGLVVFSTGLLVGIQVPGLVDLYGKLLQARVLESNASVSEFQDDADRYFHGDLDKLVEHYDANTDPVIVSGGESIRAVVTRNRRLQAALEQFRASTVSAYRHAILSPLPEIKAQLWRDYTYRIVLDPAAIGFGVAFALCGLASFEFLVFLLAMGGRVFRRARAA